MRHASLEANLALYNGVRELLESYGPVRRYHAAQIYTAGIKGDPIPQHPAIPKDKARLIYSAGLMAAIDEIDRATA